MNEDITSKKNNASKENTAENESRLKKLTLDKEIASLEQQIAEARKATLEAQLPAPKIEGKPEKGKITVDDKFGYVAELAAYNSMVYKAEFIASRIRQSLEKENTRILIVDSLDFCSDDAQLLEINNQIKKWEDALTNQKKEIDDHFKMDKFKMDKVSPSTVPLNTAIGIIDTVTNIIGYFSVDYDLKGREVDISGNALHALVADRIKEEYTVYMLNFHRIESSKLLENFDKLIEARQHLFHSIIKLKNDVTIQTAPAIEICTRADDMIKNFDEFNKTLTTAPTDKKYSPLISAVIRSYFKEKKITHLLYLTVTSSGGQTITSTGLFRRSKASFFGGGVFTFVLADCEGKIIAADSTVGASYVKFNLSQDNLPLFKIWKNN
jgi:hypothetical protein